MSPQGLFHGASSPDTRRRTSVTVRYEVMSLFRNFIRDDRGLETVEYAIITGLVVAGTIAAITALGTWVSGQMAGLQTTLGA